MRNIHVAARGAARATDGQKVLPVINRICGENEATWRALVDMLLSRGLRTPELVLFDGGSGLNLALAALLPDASVKRCPRHIPV
jgi:transposase-like protein